MAMHSANRLERDESDDEEIFSLPMNRETWMSRAACSDIDPHYELFFPENRPDELAAKRVCAVCPVAWQCLDLSIRNKEVWGIWGGMTFGQRCDFTQKYRGHTSPTAKAAHHRYITELNGESNADRSRGVRPKRQGHSRRPTP